jgi:hypothetical protein
MKGNTSQEKVIRQNRSTAVAIVTTKAVVMTTGDITMTGAVVSIEDVPITMIIVDTETVPITNIVITHTTIIKHTVTTIMAIGGLGMNGKDLKEDIHTCTKMEDITTNMDI